MNENDMMKTVLMELSKIGSSLDSINHRLDKLENGQDE